MTIFLNFQRFLNKKVASIIFSISHLSKQHNQSIFSQNVILNNAEIQQEMLRQTLIDEERQIQIALNLSRQTYEEENKRVIIIRSGYD